MYSTPSKTTDFEKIKTATKSAKKRKNISGLVAAEELETISVKKAMFEKELRNAKLILKKKHFKCSSDELIAAFETNFSSITKDNTSEIPDLNVSELVGPEEFKPFKCAFCDERFLTQKSLNQHEKKRRKWKCNFCAKGFAKKASVASHARKAHFDTTNLSTEVTFEPGFFEELGYLETSKCSK